MRMTQRTTPPPPPHTPATRPAGSDTASALRDTSAETPPRRDASSDASPKSAIFTHPPLIRTFSGFKSRWMMPASCRCDRPRNNYDETPVLHMPARSSPDGLPAAFRHGAKCRARSHRRKTPSGCSYIIIVQRGNREIESTGAEHTGSRGTIDCVGCVSLKKSDDASVGSIGSIGSISARRLLTPNESEDSIEDDSE